MTPREKLLSDALKSMVEFFEVPRNIKGKDRAEWALLVESARLLLINEHVGKVPLHTLDSLSAQFCKCDVRQLKVSVALAEEFFRCGKCGKPIKPA